MNGELTYSAFSRIITTPYTMITVNHAIELCNENFTRDHNYILNNPAEQGSGILFGGYRSF